MRSEQTSGERQTRDGREAMNGGGTEYQRRFDELQSRFIDEPREAAREAETLVREAVDHFLRSVQVGGDQDTEALRVRMQRYRSVLVGVTEDGGGHHAAGVRREPEQAAEPATRPDTPAGPPDSEAAQPPTR